MTPENKKSFFIRHFEFAWPFYVIMLIYANVMLAFFDFTLKGICLGAGFMYIMWTIAVMRTAKFIQSEASKIAVALANMSRELANEICGVQKEVIERDNGKKK